MLEPDTPDTPRQPDDPPVTEDSDNETDPWDRFAPEPAGARLIERVVHRILDVVDRIVHHEWVLMCLGALSLAVVMTWPVLRDPAHALPAPTASGPLALGDPALGAWQLAWAGHALTHDPTSLLQTNALHGNGSGYPLASGLLGYAPLAMIGSGMAAAILRYNIIFVLAFALATVGGYALLRQLGSGKIAAATAAVAFSYAPWRLGQAGHLDAMSTGGVALSLAMLARGHGWSLGRGGRRPVRPGWAIAGWLVAAWQLTLGYNTAVPFGYLLAVGAVAFGLAWLIPKVRKLVRERRLPSPRRVLRLVLAFDLLGVAVVSATAAGLWYLHHLADRQDLDVSRQVLSLSSPPIRGFLTAPAESLLWGGEHAAPRAALSWPHGMAVLPGYFLCALAIVGLVMSVWTATQRVVLLAGTAVTIVLAMGTAGPGHGRGYLSLYWNLPGFDVVRSPSWLVLWTTLLLAILAAGAITAMGRRARAVLGTVTGHRTQAATRWMVRVAAVVPFGLVLAEGLPSYHTPTVPKAPAAVGEVAAHRLASPVLVLPTSEAVDPTVLLWTVDGFPKVANGAPGTPERLRKIREVGWAFPGQDALDTLRELGVRTVIVPRRAAVTAGYAAAVRGETDDLAYAGVTVTADGEAIVYTFD